MLHNYPLLLVVPISRNFHNQIDSGDYLFGNYSYVHVFTNAYDIINLMNRNITIMLPQRIIIGDKNSGTRSEITNLYTFI